MAGKAETERVIAEITRHRDRAEQARRLAATLSDAVARQGMLRHAADLERQAQALEATLAAPPPNNDAG